MDVNSSIKEDLPVEKKRFLFLREIIETLVLTVVIFVLINLSIQNYDVEGPSMEPTLHNQERIMVDKVSYHFWEPARGDVVVFVAPHIPSDHYVKRIIAVPGDVVSVDGTTVTVNGVVLNETYVHNQWQGNPFGPVESLRVPEGQYFVMGDNRANSSDSRDWGFLPRSNIVGRAVLVYWPLGQDNIGFLADAAPVFEDVEQNRNSSIDIGQIPKYIADSMYKSGLHQRQLPLISFSGTPLYELLRLWERSFLIVSERINA